jgi:bifunctional non-homologous end joining protein LigD
VLPRTGGGVLYVDHVAGRGEELLEVVRRSGLPGVVAKDSAAAYQAGPTDSWREIDAPRAGEPAPHVLEALAKPGEPRTIRSRVKLSNLDKVYWPREGFTKGQLLDYYDRIADTLLPYLRDRPIHLLRYPEGIEGHAFYQKDLVSQLPDWVVTAAVAVKNDAEVRYIVCNDRDTLLYMVNLGSIDLHPWMSRVGTLENPDYLVIDLDPSTEDFAPVVRIARALGKLLQGAGMRPLLKTSGASGLHVVIGLRPGYTYEQARMFAELVARLVCHEHADIATVERAVAKRGRKVYVDYLQNAREQTVVPPYVVRPKPGATVSTPLDWDELDSDLRREDLTMFTVPARLAERGDLFRGVLDDPHDLVPAVERLQGA